MEAPILAAYDWPTNGHLIEAVASLYLDRDFSTLDPTYGKGNWWTRWRPENLTTHDLKIDGQDFRSLPYRDGSFAQIAYDPPYVSVGGRKTTTIPGFHESYGIDAAPTSPAGVQDLINEGLAEMVRLLTLDGILLVKCQDYISSGKFWPGTYLTQDAALSLGLETVDRLEHTGTPRPQPSGRTSKCGVCRGSGGEAADCLGCGGSGRVASRQAHARRNLSTLFVFTKR